MAQENASKLCRRVFMASFIVLWSWDCCTIPLENDQMKIFPNNIIKSHSSSGNFSLLIYKDNHAPFSLMNTSNSTATIKDSIKIKNHQIQNKTAGGYLEKPKVVMGLKNISFSIGDSIATTPASPQPDRRSEIYVMNNGLMLLHPQKVSSQFAAKKATLGDSNQINYHVIRKASTIQSTSSTEKRNYTQSTIRPPKNRNESVTINSINLTSINGKSEDSGSVTQKNIDKEKKNVETAALNNGIKTAIRKVSSYPSLRDLRQRRHLGSDPLYDEDQPENIERMRSRPHKRHHHHHRRHLRFHRIAPISPVQRWFDRLEPLQPLQALEPIENAYEMPRYTVDKIPMDEMPRFPVNHINLKQYPRFAPIQPMQSIDQLSVSASKRGQTNTDSIEDDLQLEDVDEPPSDIESYSTPTEIPTLGNLTPITDIPTLKSLTKSPKDSTIH